MTHDELREKVAREHYNREIRQPHERSWESLKPGVKEAFRQTADPYIAIALEEAARVAEDKAPVTQDAEGDHYSAFCADIAAAIRAMKEKP